MTEGKILRKARKKLNLTQRDLGNHMGWCNMFISNMERDLCGIPLKALSKLSKKLKIKKEVFLRAKFRKLAKKA